MKRLLILGTDCSECGKLYRVTEQAAREVGVPYEINKVTDLEHMVGLGVMMMPALAVDGKVKVEGRVPLVDEVKELLA